MSTASRFVSLLALGATPSDAARAVTRTERGSNSYRFTKTREINTYWVSNDSSLALEIHGNGMVIVNNCRA